MKIITLIILSCWVLTTVQAASFDCAKASTSVDKMICSDGGLSKLDEELNASYQSALQSEDNAESVRQAQKQWIKERNACSNVLCLKEKYKTRITQLSRKGKVDDSVTRAIKETFSGPPYTESELHEALQQCDRNERTLGICAKNTFVVEHEKLSGLVRDQLSRVRGTSSEKQLIMAQNAWIRFRDLDCNYQASGVEDGSMYGQYQLDCMRERTLERIKQFESFLTCNDNGCPGQQFPLASPEWKALHPSP